MGAGSCLLNGCGGCDLLQCAHKPAGLGDDFMCHNQNVAGLRLFCCHNRKKKVAQVALRGDFRQTGQGYKRQWLQDVYLLLTGE